MERIFKMVINGLVMERNIDIKDFITEAGDIINLMYKGLNYNDISGKVIERDEVTYKNYIKQVTGEIEKETGKQYVVINGDLLSPEELKNKFKKDPE